MDTSSPFVAPVSPIELERRTQVTLSQLLQHVRSADQREAFLRDVVYNSPAPSVASSGPSSRRSKRAGLILVTDQIKVWSDDEDDSEPETAITSSSLASFNGRRSLQSGWWDEETDSEDEESPSIPVMARRGALTPSKRSIENMKTFDPAFSFSRRCLTSPVESVDPLYNWFAQSD